MACIHRYLPVVCRICFSFFFKECVPRLRKRRNPVVCPCRTNLYLVISTPTSFRLRKPGVQGGLYRIRKGRRPVQLRPSRDRPATVSLPLLLHPAGHIP